jgi:solute carrier family 13 (sodium-dependent dicarboxylate transporter), member 2/3/5
MNVRALSQPGVASAKLDSHTIKRLVAIVLIGAIVASSYLLVNEPIFARALAIAGICLVLWLTEVVPPYVPTLLLWAITPLLLGGYSEQFQLGRVLGWSANPVLALFLGGLALSVAATRHGIDILIARLAVRVSGGHRLSLVALVIAATAILSMWMSNIAAAAMMIVALHPLFHSTPKDDRFRRSALLAIAIGANFGGIATPIGTGPNAIAIASVSNRIPVTFLHWMVFALPLALGLMIAAYLLLIARFRLRDSIELPELAAPVLDRSARLVIIVFFTTVVAWLTEPIHGASAGIVALMATAALFGFKLLKPEDIKQIDWSTLGLIAGGIGLGALLDHAGLAKFAGAAITWQEIPYTVRLLLLCLTAAFLSALMSNTASVTMLIPIAAAIDTTPSTAILIAISASLGTPFVISTPPNAMIYGEGGITFADLAIPGLILMILGCVLVSLTGPFVLNLAGIP